MPRFSCDTMEKAVRCLLSRVCVCVCVCVCGGIGSARKLSGGFQIKLNQIYLQHTETMHHQYNVELTTCIELMHK